MAHVGSELKSWISRTLALAKLVQHLYSQLGAPFNKDTAWLATPITRVEQLKRFLQEINDSNGVDLDYLDKAHKAMTQLSDYGDKVAALEGNLLADLQYLQRRRDLITSEYGDDLHTNEQSHLTGSTYMRSSHLTPPVDALSFSATMSNQGSTVRQQVSAFQTPRPRQQ